MELIRFITAISQKLFGEQKATTPLENTSTITMI